MRTHYFRRLLRLIFANTEELFLMLCIALPELPVLKHSAQIKNEATKKHASLNDFLLTQARIYYAASAVGFVLARVPRGVYLLINEFIARHSPSLTLSLSPTVSSHHVCVLYWNTRQLRWRRSRAWPWATPMSWPASSNQNDGCEGVAHRASQHPRKTCPLQTFTWAGPLTAQRVQDACTHANFSA